jgi:molybdopterin-dependent oxidoreductase alpha subunit
MRKTKAGGGWQALYYSLKYAMDVGPWRLWKKMVSRNACKTCAVGMGGAKGGMVNEAGHFPEVCKKSLQAQAADMKGAIFADFFDKNDLDHLLKLTPKQAEDAGRLTFPVILKQGGTHYQPISWDAAMHIASQALIEANPDTVAFYASGRSSNEAAFLLQSFARVYGTNNVMNCSFYCHQASGVALKQTFGTGTATITLDDLEHSDLVFIIGANPASNHPRIMTQLANVRNRGGDVIIINPVKESGLVKFHVPSQVKSMLFGSEIASMYVQPLAGGDVGLMVGVLKSIVDAGKANHEFLSAYTENFQPVLDHVSSLSWDEIVANCGVPKEEIERIANRLSQSKNTIFCWSMGLTHHQSGVDNVQALCNIALATGMVGRRGAGLLPLRGHSNVQGVGSVGVTPGLQDGVRQALERAYGRPFPTKPGYDTWTMMDAAGKGGIKTLIALGGNLWGSNPDLDWAAEAMRNIETVVYLSTKLNPGHFHGIGKTTLVLPVFARDEEPQGTTQESMFNFVRYSEGGQPNVSGGMRAESAIICDLATMVLGNEPVDWNRLRSHSEIRKIIGEVIPGWQEITNIDDTRKEFTIPGRVYHAPKFNTVNGKAAMHVTPLPVPLTDGLRLITLRSEGQFNSVVYEENDIYRGMPHRHCILMSESDVRKMSLRDGQRVKVRGEAGIMVDIEVVVGDVRPGVVAMFYPEANMLIKDNRDSRSGTPAFKSAPVWIEA